MFLVILLCSVLAGCLIRLCFYLVKKIGKIKCSNCGTKLLSKDIVETEALSMEGKKVKMDVKFKCPTCGEEIEKVIRINKIGKTTDLRYEVAKRIDLR